MSAELCPHCGHEWSRHTDRCDGRVFMRRGCQPCGCYWKKPVQPVPPPPSPTAEDLLVERVCEAMFDELDRQHDADDIDGAGYWSREWGCLDGEPNWGRVAAAAIRAVRETS